MPPLAADRPRKQLKTYSRRSQRQPVITIHEDIDNDQPDLVQQNRPRRTRRLETSDKPRFRSKKYHTLRLTLRPIQSNARSVQGRDGFTTTELRVSTHPTPISLVKQHRSYRRTSARARFAPLHSLVLAAGPTPSVDFSIPATLAVNELHGVRTPSSSASSLYHASRQTRDPAPQYSSHHDNDMPNNMPLVQEEPANMAISQEEKTTDQEATNPSTPALARLDSQTGPPTRPSKRRAQRIASVPQLQLSTISPEGSSALAHKDSRPEIAAEDMPQRFEPQESSPFEGPRYSEATIEIYRSETPADASPVRSWMLPEPTSGFVPPVVNLQEIEAETSPLHEQAAVIKVAPTYKSTDKRQLGQFLSRRSLERRTATSKDNVTQQVDVDYGQPLVKAQALDKTLFEDADEQEIEEHVEQLDTQQLWFRAQEETSWQGFADSVLAMELGSPDHQPAGQIIGEETATVAGKGSALYRKKMVDYGSSSSSSRSPSSEEESYASGLSTATTPPSSFYDAADERSSASSVWWNGR